MAEKDIHEKILLSYADVFADCENALVYGGRQRVRAQDLQPAPTESWYQGRGGGFRSQFADVGAYLMDGGEVRMQFLIGNETGLERRQVLRKVSYQGGAYRSQLESGKPVYPVAGMVIDWTHRGSRIPLSLHGLLEGEGVPREDLEHVDDVRLEVYHMNSLPKEVRERFVSDMGFVVDYLNEGGFEGRAEQRIVHAEALCGMMEALTGDCRFTEMVEELLERQKKGEVRMCEYIDMLEARGEARGRTEGEARGITKGENRLAQLLERLYSLGRDDDAKLAVMDGSARTRLYRELHIGEAPA